MKGLRFAKRPRVLTIGVLAVGAALAVVSPLAAGLPTTFHVTRLVSDQPGAAQPPDPDLVNAWGLVSGPTTPWWVSDNGTNKSTLYRGSDGQKQGLVVTVAGGPTGTVFNSTAGFVLPSGGKALFLFDTENGLVRAWNGAQGTTAIRVADRSDVDAVYKGLALANTPAGPRLFAADFHNKRIDVFDTNFTLVPNSGFVDPSLPHRFAPFNVQVIGTRVFVAYAKQDDQGKDEEPGPGKGFVDVYDLSGNLLGSLDDGRGQLNAPWGLAVAPPTFGTFAGDLLVGNFGDGLINAYREDSPNHFVHDGKIRGADNRPLAIDGLWALQFGQGGNNGPAGTLFFTAGPAGESQGLFGQINPN
ncbi:MAG TPA: TIGR03118 family protein [Gaiellaceae bacterium]|nr:TIGR03118 family protein [Gaiellaceae bacterium]